MHPLLFTALYAKCPYYSVLYMEIPAWMIQLPRTATQAESSNFGPQNKQNGCGPKTITFGVIPWASVGF